MVREVVRNDSGTDVFSRKKKQSLIPDGLGVGVR